MAAPRSRLAPKRMKDLLASSVLPTLQKESLSIETDTDEGTDTQTLLNDDSYLFSNFATAVALELLAIGGPTDAVKQLFIPHFENVPLPWVNEIFPLTIAFYRAAGFADGPLIKVATRNWLQRHLTLKSEVDNVLKNTYQSDICYQGFFSKIFKSSFPLVTEVNAFLRHTTSERLRDAFGSVTVKPTTRVLATATIDFTGEWGVKFQNAGVKTFTLPSGDVVRVPYMTSKEKQYVKQFPNFKVLRIPFKQNEVCDFAMLFYLPDETADFKDLQQFIGMNESVIMEIDNPTEAVEVQNLLLPKFRLQMRGVTPLDPSTYLLDDLVDNYGDDAHLGAFNIVNNSFLEVTEKGTRACGVATVFAGDTTITTAADASQPATDASQPATDSATTMDTDSAVTTPVKDSSSTALAAVSPPVQTNSAPAAAAASTGSQLISTSSPAITTTANTAPAITPPKAKRARFQANRPFMFFLRDIKYGRMLFSGAITDALASSFA